MDTNNHQPIRFFCGHCQLMMKLGSQMSGRVVVCPQCLKKLVVPSKSDPKAEQLYNYMRQKRTTEKNNSQKPIPAKVTAPSNLQNNLGTLETDEVDKWIDEFWTSINDNDTDNKPFDLINQGDFDPFANNDSPNNQTTNNNTTTDPTINNDTIAIGFVGLKSILSAYRWLVLVTILVIFFAGFLGGFFLGYATNSTGRIANHIDPVETGNIANKKIMLKGTLSYRNEFGVKTPDADATILCIPKEARTPVLISCKGLRADEGNFDPNSDNIHRIMELGGVVQRTGADGKFEFELKSEGSYMVIMVSSHLRRTNATQLPPTIIDELKKIFQNPSDLFSDFCVDKDEYNISQGTQFVNKTFEQ
ncbi:MAG: hypothetical protein LBQ66_03185 [Planctomycetaceae bacterium]|jgi:hypothetical protein|nr:hypothetical protein [Planctomycetaceae bacterium]